MRNELHSVELKERSRSWKEEKHLLIIDGQVVGSFSLNFTNMTKKKLFEEYADSKSLTRILKSFSLPNKFNYLWAETLKFYPKYRGKGFGTISFDWIKSFPNTLIGCNSEAIDQNFPVEHIVKFHKKQGLKMGKYDHEWYGFFYHR